MGTKQKQEVQASLPLTGEDLRKYLETQDDFALELEAYKHAHSFGFKARLAGLYDDAITSLRRQYDVRAAYEWGNRKIDLTIECKNLDATNPLLVQRVPRPEDESFHQIMLSRDSPAPAHGTTREPQGWLGAGLFKMYGTHLYDSRQPVGKSLKRVKRKLDMTFSAGDSDIYEKYTQALTSMNELVQSAGEEMRSKRGEVFARAFLPVVLVSDGTLWIADYSESGELCSDPQETDEATFHLGWNYELHNPFDVVHPATFTITHLHIVTLRQLPKLLDEIDRKGRIWQQLFGE